MKTKYTKYIADQTNKLCEVLKHNMESDVQYIFYHVDLKNRKIICQLHMKNGYIICGFVEVVVGLNIEKAKNSARIEAMKKLVMIEEYNLASKFYNMENYCA